MANLGTQSLGAGTLGSDDRAVGLPATSLNTVTNNPTFNTGDTAVSIPETRLSLLTPNIATDAVKKIALPITSLNISTINLNVDPGRVKPDVPLTTLNLTTANPKFDPGLVQVPAPVTSLNLSTDSPDVKAGNVDVSLSNTQLIVNTLEPKIVSVININSPTKAIIVNPNRKAIITKANKFVVMTDRTFKEGDLGDELEATLRDKNGKIDLSQVNSVDFVARDTKKTKVLDEQVTISDPVNGEVQYQWRQGDFIEDAGVYQAEFRINDNAGNTETVPNDGHVTIEIEEEIK